jgi:MraZ protein
MFQVRGQFDVRIDGKGRLPLPVRLRAALDASRDSRLVLAFHDGGLMGFVESRWRTMELRFAGVSIFDRRQRNFLLAFVAGACEVEPDSQGRILIPSVLRQRAGLNKRCIVASYLGLLEIWDEGCWIARQDAAAAQVALEGGLDDFVVFDPQDDGEDL